LSEIPKEGDRVIYYGSGHVEAVAQEEKDRTQYKINTSSFALNLESYVNDYSDSVAPPMWGSSKPSAGMIKSCTVTDVRFFQCHGAKINETDFALHPFAQIDLQIDHGGSNTNEGTVDRAIEMRPVEDERLEHIQTLVSSANRILSRIVHLLIDYPYAEPFITVVSRKDYPDYYAEVKNPIDLTMIKRSVSKGEYVDAAYFEVCLNISGVKVK
jgi:hypothetical protein